MSIYKIGALPQIRTETLRLLRPLSLPIGVGGHLVLPRGIEPLSMVLQTTAMTTSAKAAYLVPRWRIELPYAPCKDAVLPLNYRGINWGEVRESNP